MTYPGLSEVAPSRSGPALFPDAPLTPRDPGFPGREFLALACVGILAAAEFDAYRCAVKVETLAKGVFQITPVIARHFIGLAAVDDNHRRVAPTLVRVTQLDAPAANQRRLVL